eukprot:TRINITY_DN26640_c0_g1_i3.p1 TRINITY_DN26640_c0_g1~~TRINITY_DN26640_c0_g1_i3.p1  ORF type:complete len:210 (+),score=42.85 TRINITY_DN26640_c0_g1_i3:1700-2329(+)
MNRTIFECVRSMLSQSGFSKPFWAEAANTAVYLFNRSPNAPLNGEVLEVLWRGGNVSYNHVRTFGCEAYVYASKENRTKLDAKSRRCVFLGYGGDDRGYRLWDPIATKTIRSRDVVFNEDVMFAKKENENEKKEKLVHMQVESSSIPPQQVQEIQPYVHGDDHDEETASVKHDHDSSIKDGEGSSTTLVQELRRSTQPRKPTQRYSPSL